MLQKNFYKGKNKRCFIIATGPSTSKIDLSLLKDEITIGINDVQKSNFTPNYIVVSDPEALEKKCDHIFNEKIDHFIFGEADTVKIGPRSREMIKRYNNCTIVYNKEKKKEWSGSNMLSPHERTYEIDKERFFIDPTLETYSTYGGSCVQDLAVPTAVYLGFEEIYLIGVDGGYSHFYANEYGENNSAKKWIGRYGEKRPGHNFPVVKELLNKMKINIYNCSPSNSFEELEYVKLKEIICN